MRMNPGIRACLAAVFLVSLVTGCEDKPEPPVGARIYSGFGNYERPISTSSPDAQRWFNQGMQLTYGFNHDEAVRSFQQAAYEDPDAPMPWWGIAYCQGININDPAMTEERSRLAFDAIEEAGKRVGEASEVEKALIEALAQRYQWPAPEDRFPLDQAYADAMQRVYERFGEDPDVAALYAESLMNLQPWDYWTPTGEAKGRTEEFVKVIEGVLASHPEHPGANHFYIHATEASQDPDRAVPAADRLTSIVPGSGHLVHMPSHIYVRVGRYYDAATSNQAAIAADRAYLSQAPEPGLYAMYYAHNLHFLAYASMMAGNYEVALKAARDLEAEMPEPALREYANLIEGIMPTTFHVLIRFGKWEEILAEPDYPEWRVVSRAVRHYARSIANSALGNTLAAGEELTFFENALEQVPEDWWIFNNRVHQVLPIARAMVKGELLFREGKHEEAFDILREGVAAEDELVYDEPPAWMLPVRHALGALLVSAGEFEEAEQIYLQDLQENRDNGWSLTGLRATLAATERLEEASALDDRLAAAFAQADIKPRSSCYCEPGT